MGFRLLRHLRSVCGLRTGALVCVLRAAMTCEVGTQIIPGGLQVMSNSFKVAVRQRQSRYVRVFALLFLAAFASSRAWAAWEEGMAHIVVLQGQYMPNLVSFTADTGTASCPA